MKNVQGELKKLGEIVPYGTRRIAYSEISPESYVTTDNLLQNCEGVKIYEGTPNVDSIVRYEKGDILVSNIRPYLKKIWLADKDGGCSPDVLVFRLANKNEIDEKFVYYAMKQDVFFEHMMTGKKGMKMPRGDKNTIPDFKIPVPPLAEQQKIVSQIEVLEKQIAASKNILAVCPARKADVLRKWLEV